MYEAQVTRDPVILLTRRLWQAGRTLSQAAKDHRMPEGSTSRVITEWRRLKRLFGCRGLPHAYMGGYRPRGLSQAELDRENAQYVSPLCGNYGDWSGRTGPGKRLREMLAEERNQDDRD